MTNKIAIITGGSRGLGRNTAVNLARRGVDVIFTYPLESRKKPKVLVREIEAMGQEIRGISSRHWGCSFV